MGEVYRARDTKLKREVALKVLPDSFALDPDRLARFQREAQVLASLNHPNIAAIHGLEETNGTQALVLELVEGPTLADRIRQGPIPLDEALPIARQIADALEAAHEQGIIHRDLKPASVKVRPDGTVKVLDFGLAKALEPVSGESADSPTLTSPAITRRGVILGTAAYMSPEQAKGRAADKRSDVWAFGCVLFEMLTGTRAFSGDGLSETLAAVIKTEPDWTALPADIPAPIRRLLRRSLTKDRKGRLADASIARIEIDDAQSQPETDRGPGHGVSYRRERLAWASAVALLTLSFAAALVWALRPVPPARLASETRLEIVTPPTPAAGLPGGVGAQSGSLAISPDGLKVVFAASSERGVQLWLRSLDSVATRPLAGTDLAVSPFWSPDSRSVGFFADSVDTSCVTSTRPCRAAHSRTSGSSAPETADHPGRAAIRKVIQDLLAD